MRLVLLLLAGICIHAQPLSEILERSAAAAKVNGEASKQYAFKEHWVQVQTDKTGKETHRSSESWDIIGLEGSAYRKLVERNDKPLAAKEQKKEDERLKNETERRRKERGNSSNRLFSTSYSIGFSPEQMYLYDSTLRGEDEINGRKVWVLVSDPKPGVKPANNNEAELQHYRITQWIDQQDFNAARLQMEVITLGSRMQVGSLVTLSSAKSPESVWLPKELEFRFNLKFFKALNARGVKTYTFSEYHRFAADSRIVEEAAQPSR